MLCYKGVIVNKREQFLGSHRSYDNKKLGYEEFNNNWFHKNYKKNWREKVTCNKI